MPIPDDEVTHEDITAFVEAIWSSVTGLQLSVGGEAFGRGRLGAPLTGSVRIVGEWEGSVVVDCEPGLARRVTAAMLDTGPHEPGPDDIHDALGELANMVGGSIKALLPGPSRLSVPSVGPGAGAGIGSPSVRVTDATFESGGDRMVVTVLRHRAAAAQG